MIDHTNNLERRDIEKLELIKNYNFEKSNQNFSSHSINILGLEIRMNFYGDSALCDSFVREYYQRYHSREEDPHVIINYYILDNGRESLSHDLWNDTWPRCFYIPKDDRDYYVIERDYVGVLDQNLSQLSILGPSPSWDNPDSLDNLLALIFSRFVKNHNTLILHSSGVEYQGKAYVFYGKSGAGKSTLAKVCNEIDGLKVLACDQLFLKINNNKLYAQKTSIQMPEFDRNSKELIWEPLEVGGLIHLNRNQPIDFYEKSNSYLMAKFLGESLLYRTPFDDEQYFLDLVTQVMSMPIVKGELSYNKTSSPFEILKSKLKI